MSHIPSMTKQYPLSPRKSFHSSKNNRDLHEIATNRVNTPAAARAAAPETGTRAARKSLTNEYRAREKEKKKERAETIGFRAAREFCMMRASG